MAAELMRFFSDADIFGPSGRTEVNFYFESGKLGVSDNHRMAYPFFIRQGGKKAKLIHMDTHPDCGYFCKEARDALAQIDAAMDLDVFVRHSYYSPRAYAFVCPVSYGNWITALFRTHPHMIAEARLICYEKDIRLIRDELPAVRLTAEQEFWDVDKAGSGETYYSIDIDYYFDGHNGFAFRPEHKDPCEHFRKCLQHALVDTCSPVFVALSPSFCGGWDRTIPFVHIIDHIAGSSLAAQVKARIP